MASSWLWFWLVVTIFTGPSAPLIIKQYDMATSSNLKWFLLFLTFILYGLLIYGYIVILQDEKVSTTYTLVRGLAIIYTVLFGVLAFGEKLSYMDIFGIILVLIGSIILGIKIS